MNRILDIQVTTDVASELLDRDTLVKPFLKIDHADEDTLLDLFITEAREELQSVTGYAIGAQTRKMLVDLCEELEIPYGPHTAITAVTLITDTEQALTDGSGYNLYDQGGFYRLKPAYNGRHLIAFTGGFEADTLPAKFKGLWLRMVAHRYTHRGDEEHSLPADLKRSLIGLKRYPV